MKKSSLLLLATATALLVSACGGDRFMPPPVRAAMTAGRIVSHEEKKSDNDSISTSEVPEKILAAAQSKVPGFTLESAEKDRKLIRSNWELSGSAQGQKYKITVNRLGLVTGVDTL